MGGVRVKFDDKALNAFLVQEFGPKLTEEAEAIANDVRSAYPDLNVVTSSGVGDNGRPFGLVVIAQINGIAHQVKHGTLTRAAAQQGIETRRY